MGQRKTLRKILNLTVLDMDREECVEFLADTLDKLIDFKNPVLEAKDDDIFEYLINEIVDLATKRKVTKKQTIVEKIENIKVRQ